MAYNTAATRILVISSTAEQASHFVQSIKELSDLHAATNSSKAPVSPLSGVQLPITSPSDNQAVTSSDGSERIPWTIVNRYYTADVHFETRVLKDFRGIHVEGVPAVLYVFNGTEDYRDKIQDLAKTIEPYGDSVEVSLAVRFSKSISTDGTVAAPSTVDDEEGLDELLSTHNFEYVDGDRGGRVTAGEGGSFDDEEESAIPGLPRVIDALSTIMWPSLVQSDATRARKSRARDLLDWAREEEEEDGLKALVSPSTDHDEGLPSIHTTGSQPSASAKKSRMQREMDELQKWLEEEEQGTSASAQRREDDTAWTNTDWSDMPTTPTIRTPFGQEDFGFEDDFTDFIGAPMEVQYTGNQHASPKADRLVPMHTGASYQSLASFDENSFSSPHPRLSGDEDTDDEDLPKRDEIEETTRRIFGHALSPGSLQIPTPSPSSQSLDSPMMFSTSLAHSPSTRSRDFDTPNSSFAPDEDEDEEDYEVGAFDLSRVLSALQGMKEEISGMEDEGERRKAAARVALGLVYGLKKEEERDGLRAATGSR
ncbi:hypothetical protein BXZ70DRAFT_922522 [Cristinia sonorae]|uniref:Uncharacterized protein n=1 Tax=Cristinia sonorae TaxID=1940300 RepID=A0A8K0UUN9_9AGAR|nr:hypothetical protein BXZ70DRAFT_922522 [Cristinia sonorae]